MKNIYINNLQIHSNNDDIGFWVSPNIEGLDMASIRLPSFQRPNIDGAFVPNHLYGGRAITLRGMVDGEGSETTYHTRRRQLIDTVAIYRPGNVLTPLTMKFTTPDDKELQISVYMRDLRFPHEMLTAGEYVLELFAPDIHIVGQTLKQSQLNIFSGGGMGIPMGIPMDMSTGGAVQTVVNNAGGLVAKPYYVIYGTIEDPQITNDTTGESFSLDYTLTVATQRIEVDVENRTVLYFASATATGVNIRDKFTGDWFDLEPGNNTIKLVVVDTADTGYALIRWRDSYIGV